MKSPSVLTSLSLLALPALTVDTTITFDTVYDESNRALTSVACSDGENGLITRGFTTFGSLPEFPFIGGVAAVEGWNSKNCGTCWSISFKTRGKTNTIKVLAIDASRHEFTVSKTAMDKLTAGRAAEAGRVEAKAHQIAASECGLT